MIDVTAAIGRAGSAPQRSAQWRRASAIGSMRSGLTRALAATTREPTGSSACVDGRRGARRPPPVQQRDERLDGRRAVADRQRGDDAAPRRVRAERAQDDVLADGRDREAGDERDADARPRRAPASTATARRRSGCAGSKPDASAADQQRRRRRAARRLDPRLVAQVAQARAWACARARVPPASATNELVVDEVDELDVGALDRRQVRDDGDVDLAGAQLRRPRARVDRLDERELDVAGAARANAAIARGTIVAFGGLERADPQPAARSGWRRTRPGRARSPCGRGSPRRGRGSTRPASVRPDAARGALEQLRARLALERGDLPGDRGLGEAQRLGRRGQGAAADDLAEHAQAGGVERGAGGGHERSVWLPEGRFICGNGGRHAPSVHDLASLSPERRPRPGAIPPEQPPSRAPSPGAPDGAPRGLSTRPLSPRARPRRAAPGRSRGAGSRSCPRRSR